MKATEGRRIISFFSFTAFVGADIDASLLDSNTGVLSYLSADIRGHLDT